MTKPQSKWEKALTLRLDAYTRQIERLYRKVIEQVAQQVNRVKSDPDKPFSFEDYPTALATVEVLLSTLAKNVQVIIEHGNSSAWLLSNQKNDELVSSVFADADIAPARLFPFNQRNEAALTAFQARTTSGLTLSSRVWRYSQQFRGELELGIDTVLLAGTPASKLATQLKQYLNNPDDLFRRVRSARGNLVLSKHAAAYHPGTGIYRSSYKNAARLARTEISMAYRSADNIRWNQLPFVVGIEVRRSNNPFPCKVCDSLKGFYPKSYVFRSNHSNCRCYAVTILATKEELGGLNRLILDGQDTSGFKSVNEVTAMNPGYIKWVAENRERLLKAKSLPYFITDNPSYFLSGTPINTF